MHTQILIIFEEVIFPSNNKTEAILVRGTDNFVPEFECELHRW